MCIYSSINSESLILYGMNIITVKLTVQSTLIIEKVTTVDIVSPSSLSSILEEIKTYFQQIPGFLAIRAMS